MNRSGLVDRGISSYGVVCLWICPLFLDLNFECSHEYSKGDRSHKEKKKRKKMALIGDFNKKKKS